MLNQFKVYMKNDHLNTALAFYFERKKVFKSLGRQAIKLDNISYLKRYFSSILCINIVQKVGRGKKRKKETDGKRRGEIQGPVRTERSSMHYEV